jgi:biopolymer transport protein ExbD
MLVLLIIFMVAAPLETVDIKVDLPASSAKKQVRPDKPIFLTIKQDLSLVLGDKAINRSQLQNQLELATDNNPYKRLFLRADKTVDYSDLMAVMNQLREAGYLKIALAGLEQTEAKSATL